MEDGWRAFVRHFGDIVQGLDNVSLTQSGLARGLCFAAGDDVALLSTVDVAYDCDDVAIPLHAPLTVVSVPISVCATAAQWRRFIGGSLGGWIRNAHTLPCPDQDVQSHQNDQDAQNLGLEEKAESESWRNKATRLAAQLPRGLLSSERMEIMLLLLFLACPPAACLYRNSTTTEDNSDCVVNEGQDENSVEWRRWQAYVRLLPMSVGRLVEWVTINNPFQADPVTPVQDDTWEFWQALAEWEPAFRAASAKRSALAREYGVLSTAFFEPLDWPVTLERFHWADGMVWSRAMSLASHDKGAACAGDLHLVPVIDLCNHSPQPTVRWELDPGPPGHIRLLTQDGPPIHYRPGAELLLSYGEKSNLELLFGHGFCLRANPHDAYPIPVPRMIAWTAGQESVEEGETRQNLILRLLSSSSASSSSSSISAIELERFLLDDWSGMDCAALFPSKIHGLLLACTLDAPDLGLLHPVLEAAAKEPFSLTRLIHDHPERWTLAWTRIAVLVHDLIVEDLDRYKQGQQLLQTLNLTWTDRQMDQLVIYFNGMITLLSIALEKLELHLEKRLNMNE